MSLLACHAGVRAGISAKNVGEDADVASWKLAPRSCPATGRELIIPVINAADHWRGALPSHRIRNFSQNADRSAVLAAGTGAFLSPNSMTSAFSPTAGHTGRPFPFGLPVLAKLAQ